MCREQLLNPWFLEKLAPKLQPVAHPVSVHIVGGCRLKA